jgi:hypothetical protein
LPPSWAARDEPVAVIPARWRLALVARPGAAPLGAIFGGIGLLGGGLVALLHLDRLPFTVCFFKAFTGWPCLSCGSTRAVARLFALDLSGALRMNPLFALGALALLPWALVDLWLWGQGSALAVEAAPASKRLLRALALLALIANWAYLLAVRR